MIPSRPRLSWITPGLGIRPPMGGKSSRWNRGRKAGEMVVGVDGCRGGWLAVAITAGSAPESRVFPEIRSLWQCCRAASLILVDIPIGLPEQGGRDCDQEARKLLRGRRASVFPVPCRAAAYAPDFDTALKINQALTGKRIFRTTWNLIPRIRQVEELLLGEPEAQHLIREAHPEVLFWGLNGGKPLLWAKRHPLGEEERLAILARVWPEARDFFRQAAVTLPRHLAGRDDLLDALALAVTAKVGGRRLMTLPASPPRDSLGLPMQMVYYLAPR